MSFFLSSIIRITRYPNPGSSIFNILGALGFTSRFRGLFHSVAIFFWLIFLFSFYFALTTVVYYHEPDCCLIYSSPLPSVSPSVFFFSPPLIPGTKCWMIRLLRFPFSMRFIFLSYSCWPNHFWSILFLTVVKINCISFPQVALGHNPASWWADISNRKGHLFQSWSVLLHKYVPALNLCWNKFHQLSSKSPALLEQTSNLF